MEKRGRAEEFRNEQREWDITLDHIDTEEETGKYAIKDLYK